MFKSKLLNFKPIIFGIITWIVLFLLWGFAIYVVFKGLASNLSLTIFFIFLISGLVTGYTSGKEYLAGISNSAFVGFIFTVLILLATKLSYTVIIGAIIVGTVITAIGGIIGVFIYRLYYKRTQRFCGNCGTQLGENDKFCPECGAEI